MGNKRGGLRNMTAGSPAGHILSFALPLLAGSFLQQMYNMVDSWVVGNFVGDTALAAVGVGFPVMFLFTSLFLGFSNGGTVVIAQFYGAGQSHRVRDAVDTIYTTLLYAIVPLTVIALLLVKPLLFLLRVDESCYHDAWLYLTLICGGILGSVGYNINAGILNGLGNSRTTLLFLAISAVTNIVLDLLLVMVFGLGVAGVAIATIFAQLLSWLFGIFYINRHYPEAAIHPFCRRFDRELFRKVISIGLPAGVQMSLVSIGAMTVMSQVNAYGEAYTAAFNVGNKLDALAFLPAQSVSSAVTAFVGQNTGARKPERVRQGTRAAVIMSAAWTVFSSVLLVAGSDVMMRVFSQSEEVVAVGSLYLRSIMPPYVLFSVMFCLNNAMRGAGDSLFPMVSTVASVLLLRVPAVYLLAHFFGPQYMFWGYGIGWVVALPVTAIYYFSGRWKRFSLTAEEDLP